MGPRGSEATRSFYDSTGWQVVDGETVDARLFGERGAGPLRQALLAQRMEAVRTALRDAGPPLRLLEAGCGGNPVVQLLDLCSHYTGVDMSTTGIDLARSRVEAATPKVPFDVRVADICALPFADGSFDAVYSAHVLYHIPDVASQAAAFAQIARVLRPGGVAVLLLANPRPLLFPVRLGMRVLADTPWLGPALDSIRPRPPLPYNPQKLRWMRAQLEPYGEVTMSCHAFESTWLNHHVPEGSRLGRVLWPLVQHAEARFAHRMARLGNYVQIELRRR